MADEKKFEYIQERIDTLVEKMHEISVDLKTYTTSFDAHTKQDEQLSKELHRTNEILQENTSSLKDHMRRTDILETYVKALDARFSPIELERIRKKAVTSWLSSKMQLVVKIGAAITAAGGIGLLLKHLVHYLAQ